MTTFRLTIECDNAAFRLPYDDADDEHHADQARREVARILAHVAENALTMPNDSGGPLYDANGNKVGQWSLK